MQRAGMARLISISGGKERIEMGHTMTDLNEVKSIMAKTSTSSPPILFS